ncbi:MAG: hypothetical protein ACYC7J_17280 [Syntrophales bacterium]
MIAYMKRHERYVEEMLAGNPDRETAGNLLAYHDKQIGWMQHERLIHLIVTLFVCLFTLLSLGFAVLMPALPAFALAGLLIILSAAYLIHYYRLENRIQRWYDLANNLQRRRLATAQPPSFSSGQNPV